MQPTELGDALGPRAQHQVIGVAENDLSAAGGNLLGQHALDGAGRADRHEGGRIDHATSRLEPAPSGGPIPRQQVEGKSGHRLLRQVSKQASP